MVNKAHCNGKAINYEMSMLICTAVTAAYVMSHINALADSVPADVVRAASGTCRSESSIFITCHCQRLAQCYA